MQVLPRRSTDGVLKTIQWGGSANHAVRPDLRWLMAYTKLSLPLANCRTRTDPPDNIPGISTHCQAEEILCTLWSHTEESESISSSVVYWMSIICQGAWCRSYSQEQNSQNPTILHSSGRMTLSFPPLVSCMHTFIHFTTWIKLSKMRNNNPTF